MAAKEKAAEKRRRFRAEVLAYLGGSCRICGYDSCPSALETHHVDDLTKDFNISSKTAWSPELKAELAKVELLCVRCHREVHAGMHPRFLALEDRYL